MTDYLMTDYRTQITDYIRRNRVSSTEVADCLGKSGAIPGITPVNQGHFRVGKVYWGYAFGESNWHIHEQIQSVEEGDILVVDVFDCQDRAIFGDIVSKFLLLYKQVNAIVVDGNLRDASRLIKENWPIWCQGFNPIGCFNKNVPVTTPKEVLAARYDYLHGAIAVCDDTGVVIIPSSHHNASFLEKLQFIEEQEDIWYECIDRRKWSTFETICLKKYLDEA